ncbi:hypothetical protein AB4059_06630 [Lysobacter sp. 2RAF19]
MAQHFPESVRIGIYSQPPDTSGSPAAGQCLIRGNNGNGEFVRYNWGRGPEQWCGFPTKAEFLANRQGVFDVVYVAAQNAYLIWQGADACLMAKADGTTGVASCSQAMQDPRGMWRIDRGLMSGGVVYASIRSRFDDRCLIFGNNGYDERPTLYRWANAPADQLYCGLGIDKLVRTGQGLWMFTPLQ